uniref:Uncharacterized protein n=1 Tax=Arundo donax TaxID=35708 RepID=A0A0A8XN50_ARUDO
MLRSVASAYFFSSSFVLFVLVRFFSLVPCLLVRTLLHPSPSLARWRRAGEEGCDACLASRRHFQFVPSPPTSLPISIASPCPLALASYSIQRWFAKWRRPAVRNECPSGSSKLVTRQGSRSPSSDGGRPRNEDWCGRFRPVAVRSAKYAVASSPSHNNRTIERVHHLWGSCT